MQEKIKTKGDSKIKKKILTIWVILAVLAIVFSGGCVENEPVNTSHGNQEDREKYGSVIKELQPIYPLIEECKNIGENENISLRGVPLIWFFDTDSALKYEIYTPSNYDNISIHIQLDEDGSVTKVVCYQLDEEGYVVSSLSPPAPKEFTFFIVSVQRLEQMGKYYKNDGLPKVPFLRPYEGEAYRAKFDIYVVYWPEKMPMGLHTIISDPPEVTEKWGEHGTIKVVGNIIDIHEWIENLPRSM